MERAWYSSRKLDTEAQGRRKIETARMEIEGNRRKERGDQQSKERLRERQKERQRESNIDRARERERNNNTDEHGEIN